MTIAGIASVTSTASGEQSSGAKAAKPDELGQDAFLTLLLAQLRNQDPFKPMEDRDFVAQLAQLNSLSQLTEMNDTLTQLSGAQMLTQASTLIGKIVAGMSTTGERVTGLVTGLRLVDGKVILDVDGASVRLDTVHEVTEPAPAPAPAPVPVPAPQPAPETEPVVEPETEPVVEPGPEPEPAP